MKAHFAIIKSLTSRYSNQSIVEVHEVTDGMSNDKTISPCGRFFTYGIGYMFKSEVVTIELDEIDDLFDRTDWEPDQGTQEPVIEDDDHGYDDGPYNGLVGDEEST